MLAPSTSSMAGRQQAEQAAAFQQLRPVMTAVLQHRQDPVAMHTALCSVQQVVQAAPPSGLAACFDYVTFPLLLILESAAAARQQANQDKDSTTTTTTTTSSSSSGVGMASAAADAVPIPAAGSDRVVEALLGCLLALLQRCPAGMEPDQALSLLQRLLPLLQLPKDTASEEVRLLTWQLLCELLSTNNNSSGGGGSSSSSWSSQDAPLQQPATVWGQDPAGLAPVFGVLISSSLTAAVGEVGAPQGSREVVAAALEALQRVLVLLGPGDSLAFFLPGVASGLGKVLAVPGHPAAKAQALRALAGLLTIVLGDDYVQANTPGPYQELAAAAAAGWQRGQQQVGWGALQGGNAGDHPSGVLQQLSALSLQAQQQQGQGSGVPAHTPTTTTSSSSSGSDGRGDGSQHDGSRQQLAVHAAGRPSGGGSSHSTRPFQVVRDLPWYTTTLSKLQALLAVSLPPQMVASSVPVRAALSEAVASLLTHCWVTLGSCRSALLELLLTLSQDGFEQVSAPALAWLSSKHVTPAALPAAVAVGGRTGSQQQAAAEDGTGQTIGGPPAPAAVAAGVTEQETALGMLLAQLARGVHTAVRQGEESGAAAAQRLTGLLLLADPLLVQQQLLGQAASLKPLLADLFACFALDDTGAAQLLYSRAAARQAVAYAAPATRQDVPAGPSSTPGSTGGTSSTRGSSSSSRRKSPGVGVGLVNGHGTVRQADGAAAPPSSSSSSKGVPGLASASGPELPRMPLSLVHLTSSSSYTAVAGVARALGRCAAAADGAAGLGGHTLRRLMDLLLTALKEQLRSHHQHYTQGRKGTPGPSQSVAAAPAAVAGGGWQCGAASVLCVAAEVVFGASGAWQPPPATTAAAAAAGGSGGATCVGGGGSSMDQLSELVLPLVQAVTSDKVWGVPTTQPPPGAADIIPAQVLGLNALLLRCCCDFLGACGRSLGRTFTAPGPLLRAALLPLLDRLADPVPLVADAAGSALSCICRHGGHPGGLKELVGAHADYVVDGVCKRLRDMAKYPRAPQLLSALLQEAGVAAELLPLLSEPLRAALGGLSILARRQQPTHVIPFLHILQHVSTGCKQQAAAACTALAAWQQHYQQQAEAAGLYKEAGAADDGELNKQQQQEDEEAGPDAAAGGAAQHSRVEKFFLQHHECKAAQEGSKQQAAAERHLGSEGRATAAAAAAGNGQPQADDPAAALLGSRVADPGHLLPPGVPHTGHAGLPGPSSQNSSSSSASRASKRRPLPDSRKIVVHPADLEVLELLWRRAHAAATLADAAVQAAAPLLLLRSLREAVLASEVVTSALRALEVSTAAVDTEEALFEDVVTRGPSAQVRPVRPEVPKLLPAVHQVWGPLVACLGAASSVPVLEAGLALLSVLVQLAGGQFMARRVYKEAWPVLEPMLRTGLLHTEGAGAGAALTAASGRSTPHLQQPGVSCALLQLEAAQKQQEQQSGALTTTTASSTSTSTSSRKAGPAGDDSGPAPAAMARVQAAVLHCLAGIAASSSSAAALQQLVWQLCCAASQLMGSQQQPPVREAAGKLLKALAAVDADAVWLLLVDVGQVKLQAPAAAVGPLSAGEPAAASATGTTTSAGQLPSWEQLLPARRSSGPITVHSSSKVKGATKPTAADSCTPSVSEGASSRAAAVWSSLFAAAPDEGGARSTASSREHPGTGTGGGSSSRAAEVVQQPSVRWHGRVLDYLAHYHTARAELKL